MDKPTPMDGIVKNPLNYLRRTVTNRIKRSAASERRSDAFSKQNARGTGRGTILIKPLIPLSKTMLASLPMEPTSATTGILYLLATRETPIGTLP